MQSSIDKVKENIAFGIVGALVGAVRSVRASGVTGLNIYSMIVAIVGSVVVLDLECTDRSAVALDRARSGEQHGWGWDKVYSNPQGSPSSTEPRTLRKIYGSGFAPGCRDEEKLSDTLHKFDAQNR